MEQMIGVPMQAQVGVPVAEVIRKPGISQQTFYRWKAKGPRNNKFPLIWLTTTSGAAQSSQENPILDL